MFQTEDWRHLQVKPLQIRDKVLQQVRHTLLPFSFSFFMGKWLYYVTNVKCREDPRYYRRWSVLFFIMIEKNCLNYEKLSYYIVYFLDVPKHDEGIQFLRFLLSFTYPKDFMIFHFSPGVWVLAKIFIFSAVFDVKSNWSCKGKEKMVE